MEDLIIVLRLLSAAHHRFYS